MEEPALLGASIPPLRDPAAVMRRAAGSARVWTAGSAPAVEIAPVALRLLAEQGLNTGEEFPKPLPPETVMAADVVVTLGCGDPAWCCPAAATWTGTCRI